MSLSQGSFFKKYQYQEQILPPGSLLSVVLRTSIYLSHISKILVIELGQAFIRTLCKDSELYLAQI